jgi:hypothetical protein
MAGSGRRVPKHLPKKLGEEAIIEVADRVAKKETLASRIWNIRCTKLSGVGMKVVFIYRCKHGKAIIICCWAGHQQNGLCHLGQTGSP